MRATILISAFILLHGPSGNAILVNKDAIHVVLQSANGGSQIELMNGRDLYVKETPEKIAEMMVETLK